MSRFTPSPPMRQSRASTAAKLARIRLVQALRRETMSITARIIPAAGRPRKAAKRDAGREADPGFRCASPPA